jgi:integrase
VRFKGTTRELLKLYEESGSAPKWFPSVVVSAFPMQEIEELEKKFRKLFVEFNEDEAREFILTTRESRPDNIGNRRLINGTTYMQRRGVYQDFCSWYGTQYEPVENPWAFRSMRGSEAQKWLVESSTNRVPLDLFETAIRFVRNNYEGEQAVYAEAILQLVYNGVPSMLDIIYLREEDIDFENNSIYIRSIGKKVSMSIECAKIIRMEHSITSFPMPKRKFYATTYQGGYFKIRSLDYSIDGNNPSDYANTMNQVIKRIRRGTGLSVSSRNIYMLGFVRYCIEKVGLDYFRSIIWSEAGGEGNRKLEELAEIYGFKYTGCANFKRAAIVFDI